MATPEVLLLIFATGLLVLSFALVDKDKKSKNREYHDSIETTEVPELEIRTIKNRIKSILEGEISNAVIEAEDKMSRISNEKIMAVNDFSLQLLEKIEQNNNEVVFLYNMLTQKEEDIKNIFAKMETIRRENKEFLEKLTNLMVNKSETKEQLAKKDSIVSDLIQKMNLDKLEGNEDKADKKVSIDENIAFSDDKIMSAEMIECKRNDKILKLYKENKTILEISKILNIGQGEVKLVIDLFAKN